MGPTEQFYLNSFSFLNSAEVQLCLKVAARVNSHASVGNTENLSEVYIFQCKWYIWLFSCIRKTPECILNAAMLLHLTISGICSRSLF